MSMIVVARGEGPPGGSFVLYAAIAGLSEAVGVAALYRGLAVGAMSIVALVGGAIAPVVPVLVGILLGEFPTPIHGAGIVLAVAEIAITSGGRPSADAVAAGGLARAGLRRVTEAWKAYDAPVARAVTGVASPRQVSLPSRPFNRDICGARVLAS